MPIIDQEKFDSLVEANRDPYGKKCVDTAQRAMEILDEEPGDFDTHELICRADNESAGDGGITGFMAGAVASMISACHSRGDEFRRKWNGDNQIADEGDKANESGGVLNPALLSVGGASNDDTNR